MNAHHVKRLLKLADFLDGLPRQKFDFECFIVEGDKPMMEALKAGAHRCGTAACALGWTPAVFPRLVRWQKDEDGHTTIRLEDGNGAREARLSAALFGLNEQETQHLFYPNTHWVLPGVLPPDATPKQVAKHIRRFVAKKQREKAAA